jgi:acetyl-CoA C-acetyltransferase
VFGQAGVTNPREQIDCIEMYVPFSWYEPMWLENLHFVPEGDGWKMTEKGATALDGELPVNVSGGVLSTNPIGASGMLRFAEAALQVRGQAGEHQVDGARTALGHAYGGGSLSYFLPRDRTARGRAVRGRRGPSLQREWTDQQTVDMHSSV